jgi:hypothetical protein
MKGVNPNFLRISVNEYQQYQLLLPDTVQLEQSPGEHWRPSRIFVKL